MAGWFAELGKATIVSEVPLPHCVHVRARTHTHTHTHTLLHGAQLQANLSSLHHGSPEAHSLGASEGTKGRETLKEENVRGFPVSLFLLLFLLYSFLLEAPGVRKL